MLIRHGTVLEGWQDGEALRHGCLFRMCRNRSGGGWAVVLHVTWQAGADHCRLLGSKLTSGFCQ